MASHLTRPVHAEDVLAPVQAMRQLPWRRLGAYLKPYRRQMAVALLGLIISSVIGLIFPLIIGQTIGDVLAARDLALLNWFVLALLGLFALQAVGEYLQTYFLGAVGERVVYTLRTNLYHKLTSFSLDFYAQHRVGELVSRLSSDVTMVSTFLTTTLVTLLVALATLVGSLVIVFVLNPLLTLLMLALVPVLVIAGTVLGRPIERNECNVQDNLSRATATASEGLAGIRTVKSFGREQFENDRYEYELGQTLASSLRATQLKALFNALMVLLGFGALVAIIWFAGRQVIAGALTVTLITSFLIYGLQIAFSFEQLADIYGQFRATLGATRRVFELLDTQPTLADGPGALALPPVRGQISLDNVSFGYTPERPILHGLRVEILPGEIVALVGPSGAGKSTIFNLLLRFYDPTSGAIYIDGHDVRATTQQSLREHIGLVPQEAVLFSDSVRQNILYGQLDAPEVDLIAAAKAAHAHDFIMQLSQGYDTLVGERGANLSGGQRQRIAIARALLKNPRILLLDEATSALDSESEALVQVALANLMRDRTTLIIAHRLSTIKAADRIVVLDQGRIVESGTHDDLLARNGMYARLYALQFRAHDTMTAA